MKRSEFIKSLGGLTIMSTIDLKTFGNELLSDKNTSRMPALFIGHGSPMNAIEQNAYTQSLNKLGQSLEKPKAIMVVSAHWQTRGTYVHVSPAPKTIHDFGGFPQALFDVQYPAKGSPEFAGMVSKQITSAKVLHDDEWGLDHGAWAVLKQMYPDANIPVFQLSLDFSKGPAYHYNLAKELNALRNKGLLIIGSGNIVHNLGMLDWNNPHAKGYDWAVEFDEKVKANLQNHNHAPLIDYAQFGKAAQLAIPTNEHYLPMLYAAALQQKNEELKFFYEEMQMGSISMRCFMVS
ncbi:MAG: 4,5-DOPA dioxygenase extradiol [Bacteroidota bacterium]